jgi:hypothetical protein
VSFQTAVITHLMFVIKKKVLRFINFFIFEGQVTKTGEI